MEKTILLGDVHGDVRDMYYRVDSLADAGVLNSGDNLVWLGDVGISYGWVSQSMLMGLERLGDEYEIQQVVMRGNHDARYCRDILDGVFSESEYELEDRYGEKSYVLEKYPHLSFLLDEGGLYAFSGSTVLVIPGAYSIDKEYRLRAGYPWEKEEQLTLDEMNALLDISETSAVDAVFSHTCPLSWYPHLAQWLLPGVKNEDRRMEQFMDTVLDNVKDTCTEWWFGHYHGDGDIVDIGHLLYYGYGILGEPGAKSFNDLEYSFSD